MKKISMLVAIFLLLFTTTCFAKTFKLVGSAYIDTDAITQYKGPEGQSLLTLVGIEPGKVMGVSIYEFDITNKKYRTIYATAFNKKGGREYESTNSPDLAPNRGWKDMSTIHPNTLQLLTFCQQNPETIQQLPSVGTVESIEDSIKKLTNDINGSFGRNTDALFVRAQDLRHYIENVRTDNSDKITDEPLQLQALRVSCLGRGLSGETSAYGEGGTYYADCKTKINALRMAVSNAYKTN